MSDLISRAIEVIEAEIRCTDKEEDVSGLTLAKSLIDELPSAKPKTGEWVEVTNGRGGRECSNCHAYAPSYMSGDEYLSNYCPNCGARMTPYKGGEDE